MKKSFLGFLILFILFTTYLPKFHLSKNFNFFIKDIKIDNNYIINDKEIIDRLKFLYSENLFFLDTQKIKTNLKKETFIQSYSIKKIYPDTLRLLIVEKKPIAILQNKKKKFYISDKGDKINFIDNDNYKNLPTVFGGSEKFYLLYKDLKKINFPFEKIKSFYYFEAGRWDLIMLEDKVIKLPEKDYLFSLKNYMKSSNDNSFNIYKTYDYRVKDQLILN